MPLCPSCGVTVEGRYCPKCGIAVDAPAGSQIPPQAPPPAAGGGLAENVACALCYLLGFITGIIFLVLAPYNQNKNVRFHAFQSIFLHVAFIVLWIVIGIILPWRLSFFLSPILSLCGLALWLFLMWKAYQNQKVVLPVIGELAQKQA